MITRSYNIDLNEIQLKAENVEQAMHHDPDNPTGPFSELIREAIDEVEAYCEIKGGFVIVDNPQFIKEGRLIKLADQEIHPKQIVYGFLSKSEAVAVFTCTAGKVGEWSKELMAQGDLLKGYAVDVVGNEIVERAMDVIEARLKEEISNRDYSITTRYSPGYCNWDVREQHKIFSFFPQKFCGVNLMPSGLMKPMKTISGIIGLGRNVKAKGYSCSACEDEICIYRNVKDREEAKLGH